METDFDSKNQEKKNWEDIGITTKTKLTKHIAEETGPDLICRPCVAE